MAYLISIILPLVVIISDGVYSQLSFDGNDNIRTDVSTNLGLSPWEMYVMSDLIFKVTTKQCPQVSPEVLQSLQDMMSDSFKQAPRPDVQNDEFLPAYNKLVKCMDHVLESRKKDENENLVTSPKSKHPKGEGAPDSESSEWAAIEKPTTSTPKPSESDPDGHNWLWGMTIDFNKWFKDITRSKRDVEEENEMLVREAAMEEEKYRREMLHKRGKENFVHLFHTMSDIVRKSCPKIHRPDKTFVRKALLDMTSWATVDESETISANAHYFRKENLLQLIRECYKSQ